MILRCIGCKRYTTSAEAELRRFNTGRCAWCDGELAPSAFAGNDEKGDPEGPPSRPSTTKL